MLDGKGDNTWREDGEVNIKMSTAHWREVVAWLNSVFRQRQVLGSTTMRTLRKPKSIPNAKLAPRRKGKERRRI